MKAVILSGGKGIRAFPFTEYLPKPMLPLGGSPIVAHVIRSFLTQGFNEFILAAGYRRAELEDYFYKKDLGAKIDIVNTGEETDTGGRVYACRDMVDDMFFVTYADGLCDVPLDKLLEFHKGHNGLATITSVPMYSPYGVLDVADDGQVINFREKPRIKESWINAGFIVFDKKVFDHWQGENLEKEVFAHLIKEGLAYTYRHDGFFKSADNYKDILEFEELMQDGSIPWLIKEKS